MIVNALIVETLTLAIGEIRVERWREGKCVMNTSLLPYVYFRAIKAGKCIGMAWESCCVNDDNKISTLIDETLTLAIGEIRVER